MVAPKFTTTTQSNFTLNSGSVFGTASIVGTSTWGELNSVKDFGSLQELKDLYKSGNIIDAAQIFFAAGGASLSVLRIDDETSVSSTFKLLNGATEAISIDAVYKGTFGNGISVSVIANSTNRNIEIVSGNYKERFENLSDNDAVITALANSKLVTVTKLTNDFIDVQTKTFLTSGSNGSVPSEIQYSTAIQNNLFTIDYDYLFIPEINTDSFHTTVSAIMDNRALQENKYSLFVTGVAKFEEIETTLARTSTNYDGRLVVCHTSMYKGSGVLTDTNNWFDATYTAASLVGKMCSLPINTSPTYKSLPITSGNTLDNNSYTSLQKEQLVANGFIVVGETSRGQYGVVMGVTRTGDSNVWNFMLDNIRKVDYIRDSVYQKSVQFIGKPNDNITRKIIKSSVTSFAISIMRDRIIESYSIEVLKGTDPREININASVLLINELDYINFNLVLNI